MLWSFRVARYLGILIKGLNIEVDAMLLYKLKKTYLSKLSVI